MCFSVRSVCPGVMLLGWSGLRLGIWGGQRWKVYMASKVSSGLSGFLRLGVPCAAPGSPLGGDGRLGTISAALALSSRNLSNSGSIGSKEGNKKGGRECESGKKCVQNVAGKFEKRRFMLSYLHLSRLPHLHLLAVEKQRQQCHIWELTLQNLIHCKPPQAK